MKVNIHKYIKRDNEGNYMSGQVMFESLVTNEESQWVPHSLIVNLSKSGNPQCDTPIRNLQKHNGHAGTFGSHVLLQDYVRRVTKDIVDIVSEYNADIEELQLEDKKLDFPLVEHNEDLVPPPIEPKVIMFDIDAMKEMHEFFESMFGEDGDEIDG